MSSREHVAWQLRLQLSRGASLPPPEKTCAYDSSIFLKPSGVGRKKAPHPRLNLRNRCVYDLAQQERTSSGDLRLGAHLHYPNGPEWTAESLKGKEAESGER